MSSTRSPGSIRTFVLGTLLSAAGLLGCGDSSLDLAGVVERQVLELSAPRSELVVELPVDLGSRVEAGQIVAQLDTQVGEADLRAREAALEAARASLVEAEGEFERQQRLRRSNVATPQALDSAKRRRDEALALVAENEARIARAQKEVGDLTLRAPRAGLIDQLPFDAGERVPAGGVVAVVLADDAPWVRVWLPARAASNAILGRPARIRIEGFDDEFRGEVTYVAHQSEFTPHYALTERESAHLVFATRITIDEAPEGLRPGLAARVWIGSGS